MTCRFFFFFNDTATTEIYTLSLHDALPISHDKAKMNWLRYMELKINTHNNIGLCILSSMQRPIFFVCVLIPCILACFFIFYYQAQVSTSTFRSIVPLHVCLTCL